METLLLSLGINLTSSAIYDIIKSALSSSNTSTAALTSAIANRLNIEGAEIAAEKIISFAANNGDINIIGSTVKSESAITMSSAAGTTLTFQNSTSSTNRTQIKATGNARIVATGNARIIQSDGGSMSFDV
jgi:hypothetical protein